MENSQTFSLKQMKPHRPAVAFGRPPRTVPAAQLNDATAGGSRTERAVILILGLKHPGSVQRHTHTQTQTHGVSTVYAAGCSCTCRARPRWMHQDFTTLWSHFLWIFYLPTHLDSSRNLLYFASQQELDPVVCGTHHCPMILRS